MNAIAVISENMVVVSQTNTLDDFHDVFYKSCIVTVIFHRVLVFYICIYITIENACKNIFNSNNYIAREVN